MALVKNLDLSKEFDLHKKYDVVISLEVAEHIPKQYESIYINNITSHCGKRLVFSWAQPGKGGKGHVNEQDQDYALQVICKRGFNLNSDLSEKLRSSATICHWFSKTSLVFDIK